VFIFQVGKSRKSYDQNTDKLDTETAEVHGQSSTGVPRKSQDAQSSSAERRSQHLTEIAQLTILNERLSKENEVLRTKNLDLIVKKSGDSNANTGSSPHLCFRSKSGNLCILLYNLVNRIYAISVLLWQDLSLILYNTIVMRGFAMEHRYVAIYRCFHGKTSRYY
jgi:hypothetical protein